MAPVVFRPAPMPPSVLTEIVCDDADQRFLACVAVTSAVWGKGLQACRCPAERAAWIGRLTEYLLVARESWLVVDHIADDPLIFDGVTVTHHPARPPGF